jgi:hypothetical protein
MKTAMLSVLLASLAAAQDPAPKFEVQFKLVIEEGQGRWTFWAEGTTTLPDGTDLKARLYAVDLVDDFKGGRRPDEEGLIQERRGWRLHRIKDGRFRIKLLESARKPYSIWYRCRLTYDPEIQDIPIFDKVGEAKMEWQHDLKPASPAEFDRELAGTVKDLTRELEEVQSLFRDLRGRFQVWTRAPDAKAFEEWRKGFDKKVEAIRKHNDTRWSIWVVWLERQAKFRFESFADRLENLCANFETWLGLKAKLAAEKNAETLKELTDEEQDRQLLIMHGLNGFLAYFEEAREALGIDTPSDPDAVGALLKDYEAATDELAALAAKKDAALWNERAPAARNRARRALLKLSLPGLLPRRAYDRVLELSDKFGEMYAHFESDALGRKKPDATDVPAEHSALVAEFRKYAGVK